MRDAAAGGVGDGHSRHGRSAEREAAATVRRRLQHRRGVMDVHDCKVEAFMEIIEQLYGEHALTYYWYQHESDRLIGALFGSRLRVHVYSGGEDADAM